MHFSVIIFERDPNRTKKQTSLVFFSKKHEPHCNKYTSRVLPYNHNTIQRARYKNQYRTVRTCSSVGDIFWKAVNIEKTFGRKFLVENFYFELRAWLLYFFSVFYFFLSTAPIILMLFFIGALWFCTFLHLLKNTVKIEFLFRHRPVPVLSKAATLASISVLLFLASF